jgi:hypothetical protein
LACTACPEGRIAVLVASAKRMALTNSKHTHSHCIVIYLSCVYIGNVKWDVTRDITAVIAPYLLTLAIINDLISVVLPKVAKASK